MFQTDRFKARKSGKSPYYSEADTNMQNIINLSKPLLADLPVIDVVNRPNPRHHFHLDFHARECYLIPCFHIAMHMSVHLSPTFKQQHVSTEQTLLYVQGNSSRTSSGAGLVLNQTNSTSFDVLHTFQPYP